MQQAINLGSSNSDYYYYYYLTSKANLRYQRHGLGPDQNAQLTTAEIALIRKEQKK